MTSQAIENESDANGENAVSPSQMKLPMFDLKEAMKITSQIRDMGLEEAKMDDVAKKLGYSGQSSTPFYRRIAAAARLFGLLLGKSTVSPHALNYFKPHDEGMKEAALVDAVCGVAAYAELLKTYVGKKLNVDLLGNRIAKDYGLDDANAVTGARAFVASLEFAGMLAPDGSVQSARTPTVQSPPEPQEPHPAPATEATAVEKVVDPLDAEDSQQQTLLLDKAKAQRFTFIGPISVRKSQLERIVQWLRVTMIVEDDPEPEVKDAKDD